MIEKFKTFTLIEMLVVIAVFGLIMAIISSSIIMLYRRQDYTMKQSIAIGEAREGLDTMIDELKEMRDGESGWSYAIEKANGNEIIFYSDIDNDGIAERVRYSLGIANINNSLTSQCSSFSAGGSCNINFNNFLQGGTVISGEVEVAVEGDVGWNNKEYVDIYGDSQELGTLCENGCYDCTGTWQDNTIYDVKDLITDNNISFIADSSSRVGRLISCDWQEPDHAFLAYFNLRWEEEAINEQGNIEKGIVEPTGFPKEYNIDNEEVFNLSNYVTNDTSVFTYYDKSGLEIVDPSSRLADIKMIKIFLSIDVDETRPAESYELESTVTLRNIYD
jgi:prepilin-type N-terminal cleavage/methylation domain-containing protein